MIDLIAWMMEHWWYGLLASLLLAGVIGWFVVRFIKKGQGSSNAAQAGVEGKTPSSPAKDSESHREQVAHSFREALSHLSNRVAGTASRYQIPWYVLLGEPLSGKTALLANSGLNLPFGPPASQRKGTSEQLDWWFFDQGVVLDVNGECMTSSNGGARGREVWEEILSSLVKHRPQRPIDGVVVTIPASCLYGHALDHPGQVQVLKDQADGLYERLCQAQRILGLNLPVYILVTKCDVIPGFDAFCEHLPVARKSEIFGWSNPYSLDVAYAPAWIPGAFQTIRQDLNRLQLELFAETSDKPHHDTSFIFPDEFLSMEESTAYLLNHLFKNSAYHDTFFLRGLYFCGSTQGVPGDSPDPAMAGEMPGSLEAVRHEIVFIRDLFQRRIFPERALAKPAVGGLVSRNRLIVAAQCFMLLIILGGGWGLWNARDDIQQTKRELYPLLVEVRQDLERTETLQEDPMDAESMKGSTQGLLAFMNRMNASRFQWAFVPTSWVSSLNDHIVEAITIAYNRIILQSVASGLQEKVQEVLEDQPGRRMLSGDIRLGASIDETPEFLAWSQYAADVTALQAVIEQFNALQAPGVVDLEKFAKVVDYVYPNTLTREFYDHPGLYQKALAQAGMTPIDFTSADQEKATAVLWDHSLRLFHHIFENNRLFRKLAELTETVQGLRQSRSGDRLSISRLAALHKEFEMAETLLHSSEGKWLTQPTLQLGWGYDQTLASTDQSKFFIPGLSGQIKTEAEQGFGKLQAQLFGLTIHPGLPLLHAENSDSGLEFSEQAKQLHAAVGKVLALKIVQSEGTKYAGEEASTLHIVWHPEYLTQAITLWKEYQEFSNKELPKLPAVLAEPLRRIVLRELEYKMTARVAQAQEPVVTRDMNLDYQLEQDVRTEAKSFVQAKSALENILHIYQDAGFENAYWDVHELLTAQAHDVLTRVDQLMAGHAFYAVQGGSLDWWDGEPPLAARAYAVTTPLGMQTYLESQRDRIRYVAQEYARPMLEFLLTYALPQTESTAQRYRVAQWQGILTALEEYDKKKPGNSLSNLEHFIAVDMHDATGQTCWQQTPTVSTVGLARDYFQETKEGLFRLFYERCQALAGYRVETGYQELHSLFTRHLAGRFPFSDLNRPEKNVAFDDMKMFFRVYDRHFPSGGQGLGGLSVWSRERKQATDFITQMGEVRSFFSQYLDQSKPGMLPTFQVETEFRVNQLHERGGNQVMDWGVTIGSRQLTGKIGELSSKVRWSYGDPIRVTFRWAKDAPRQPVRDPRQPHLQVEDHVASFLFENSWALLSLLSLQASRSGDFEQYIDPRPHTLKFVIPTQSDPNQSETRASKRGSLGSNEASEEVELFVRMVITAPGADGELVLPWFPVQAPPLPHLVAEKRSQP